MPKSVVRRVRSLLARTKDRESYDRHGLVGPSEHWQQTRDFQIAFLRDHGLTPQSKLVDIGCGTLRGGIPIIRYLEPGHYTGIDASPERIAEAEKELAHHGLEHKRPTILVSDDFRTLRLDTRFDVAWSFAVLLHLDDETLEACVSWVAEHLVEGGVFFGDAKIGERVQNVGGRGWPVITRPLADYEGAGRRSGLEVKDLGSIFALGHRTGMRGDERHMLRFNAAGGR